MSRDYAQLVPARVLSQRESRGGRGPGSRLRTGLVALIEKAARKAYRLFLRPHFKICQVHKSARGGMDRRGAWNRTGSRM